MDLPHSVISAAERYVGFTCEVLGDLPGGWNNGAKKFVWEITKRY